MFTLANLQKTVEKYHHLSAKEMVDAILKEIQSFIGTAEQHDDITLLDIIEMVVDCVCAGKARNGEVRPLEINDAILKKALDNTVKLIDSITEVVDKE